MNALEEEEDVDEKRDEEEELEEDVRYVSDDLEEERLEERDDEFAKVCDKLLELEITGNMISICSIHSN